jgi:hypothetical protein
LRIASHDLNTTFLAASDVVQLHLNYVDFRSTSAQLRAFDTQINAIEADFTAQATSYIAAADTVRQNEQRRLDALQNANDAEEVLFARWNHVIDDISTQLQTRDRPSNYDALMRRLHDIAIMVSATNTTRFHDALTQAFRGPQEWKNKINGLLQLMIRAADRRATVTTQQEIDILADLETQFNKIMSDMTLLYEQSPTGMDDTDRSKRVRDADNRVTQVKSFSPSGSSDMSHTTDLHDSAGAGSEHMSAGVDPPDISSRRRRVTAPPESWSWIGRFRERMFGEGLAERPPVDNGAAGGTSQATIRRRIDIEARRLHARSLLTQHNRTQPRANAIAATQARITYEALRQELARNSAIADAESQTAVQESGHAFNHFARMHDISDATVQVAVAQIVALNNRSRLSQLWYDYTENMKNESTRADDVTATWTKRYDKWFVKHNNPDMSSGSSVASVASSVSYDADALDFDLTDRLPPRMSAPMAGSDKWFKSTQRSTSWKNTVWNIGQKYVNLRTIKGRRIHEAIKESIKNNTDCIRPEGEDYDDEEWEIIVRRETNKENEVQKKKKK